MEKYIGSKKRKCKNGVVKTKQWGKRGSNPRPLGLESSALPLSYSPTTTNTHTQTTTPTRHKHSHKTNIQSKQHNTAKQACQPRRLLILHAIPQSWHQLSSFDLKLHTPDLDTPKRSHALQAKLPGFSFLAHSNIQIHKRTISTSPSARA